MMDTASESNSATITVLLPLEENYSSAVHCHVGRLPRRFVMCSSLRRRNSRVIVMLTQASVLVSLLIGTTLPARCDEPFPDVPKDHWAYNAVQELRDKGIFIGYPNGTFNGVVPKGIPKPRASY